jgi:hypothetical protein
MLMRAIGWAAAFAALAPAPAQEVAFHREVLPILERRCQECHRPGQIGPMPLTTYAEVRPWARAIREAVLTRRMPPWFADSCCGRFANDRRLTREEIEILSHWAESGAPEGAPRADGGRRWNEGWNLARVDAVVAMPEEFAVPATGAVEYQYFIVTPGFAQDRWVAGVEVRPRERGVVHHAVVYVREPGDTWTRGPTMADILTVYAPGSGADTFPEGMAKLIPRGADLVLEVHYTPGGKAVRDRIEVGLALAPERPARRVITLQMDSTRFVIPPGARNHRVTVQGTLPNDALLISLFPHMHLRGKTFEYEMIPEGGQPVTLLRVDPYDFHWQLSYRLAEPLPLKQGTRLVFTATYDNSAVNPRNPDPAAEVRYGHQSWEEMMVGFFDIAVDTAVDKRTFFVRQ